MRIVKVFFLPLVGVLVIPASCARPVITTLPGPSAPVQIPASPAAVSTTVPAQIPAPVATVPTPGPTTPEPAPAPVTPKPVQVPTIPISALVIISREDGISMSKEFVPREIMVPVGATVTWTNRSIQPHSVISDTGLFKATLLIGEVFSYTFTESGSFGYHCDFFDMVGTVYVK